MEGGDQILTFARLFYGTPSTYLWEDEMGNTQGIPQGRRGAGRPPHANVVLFGRTPFIGEDFLIEVARSIHHGKTHVWNRGGIAPEVTPDWRGW